VSSAVAEPFDAFRREAFQAITRTGRSAFVVVDAMIWIAIGGA
jgi:hypothetical protein